MGNDFVKRVAEISGENLFACNQCAKCAAGCPMAFAMDYLPNRIMILVQLGREETLARSRTPWLCAACLTCAVRCPRQIDLGRVMEALRAITLRKNIDYLNVLKIPSQTVAELPQIALVGAFRKHTA